MSSVNVKELVQDIRTKNGKIEDVYFVACGGSLIDLYDGYFFLTRESDSMHAMWMTAKEFVLMPPRKLGTGSLVIACSHSGNTKEVVEALDKAVEVGAYPVTMTFNAESKCMKEAYNPIVYDWADDTDEKDKPLGIVLDLLNELLHEQEGYALYDQMEESLAKIDGICRKAMKKAQNKAWLYADKNANHPYTYILSSGAAYAQSYGFAICSLQEMQWMDCCYLNSAEFFHGPFELTDDDHVFILLKSVGRQREIDERAEDFLKKYSTNYEVIDAAEFGLAELPEEVADYFNAPLFYDFSVLYRNAVGYVRRHPTDMRRYMGVVEY